MAKWGKCDYKQLKMFKDKLEKLSNSKINKVCIEISKELAARLLRKVIKRTPVGEYSQEITAVAKEIARNTKKGKHTLER